jgi:hypothetical protein
MRHDEFDVRIAVRDLPGNHVQYKDRVFERGADGGAKPVFGDDRRADAGIGRVHEQDRARRFISA